MTLPARTLPARRSRPCAAAGPVPQPAFSASPPLLAHVQRQFAPAAHGTAHRGEDGGQTRPAAVIL